MKKKFSEVLIERYKLVDVVNKLTTENLSSTETANVLYNLALKIHKDIMGKDDFYPTPGTAFIDKAYSPPKLLISEKTEELSSNYTGDCVAFYCRDNGIGEFPRWLESVRNGSIEVIFCPKKGKISSNEEYLTFWKKDL
jgi:hypothetical protein